MKFTVCFITIIGYCLALPASKVIEPVYAYVQPRKAVEVDANVPAPRIVGGYEVVPHSAPYQVAVLVNGAGLCGGSLISTTRVLTAAHCTVGASFLELRIGAHYFNQEEPDQVRLTSTSVVNHEGYVRATLENDVSVILLSSAVTLSNAIQAIPLAPSTAPDYLGRAAYVTGWGLTENFALSQFLRGVNVTVISNSECSSFFSNVVGSTICTSGIGRVGACSSDSGGPLVIDGVQIGVVSFGQSPCTVQFPTGFARVSSFKEWIKTNAGV